MKPVYRAICAVRNVLIIRNADMYYARLLWTTTAYQHAMTMQSALWESIKKQ